MIRWTWTWWTWTWRTWSWTDTKWSEEKGPLVHYWVRHAKCTWSSWGFEESLTQFSVNEKQKVPNGQNKATLGRIFMCYVNSVGIGHRYCTGMLNDLPHCQVENAWPTRSRLKAHKMLKVLLPPMLHPRRHSYLSQIFTGSFYQIRCLLYFCFWYEMQIPSLKICIPHILRWAE